jgi:hypothetical protein
MINFCAWERRFVENALGRLKQRRGIAAEMRQKPWIATPRHPDSSDKMAIIFH